MRRPGTVALWAAGLGAAAGALYASGILAWLADPERVRDLLLGSGWYGPLLYVTAFALLEPLGLPGAAFVLVATLVWPPWLAFLLSWIGALGAGAAGFAAARWLIRDWVSARLPERFRRYDRRLADRGVQTVILVRLLFFLSPAAHLALGVSQVRFGALMVGSSLGFVPGIALLTVGGKRALAWLDSQSLCAWAAVGAVLLGLGVARLVYRRRAARAAAVAASD